MSQLHQEAGQPRLLPAAAHLSLNGLHDVLVVNELGNDVGRTLGGLEGLPVRALDGLWGERKKEAVKWEPAFKTSLSSSSHQAQRWQAGFSCAGCTPLTDSVRLMVGSKGWWSTMVNTSSASRLVAPSTMVSSASLAGCNKGQLDVL